MALSSAVFDLKYSLCLLIPLQCFPRGTLRDKVCVIFKEGKAVFLLTDHCFGNIKKLVLLRSVLGVSFRAAAEPCNSQNNVQSVLLQPVCASVWRCVHSLADLLWWTSGGGRGAWYPVILSVTMADSLSFLVSVCPRWCPQFDLPQCWQWREGEKTSSGKERRLSVHLLHRYGYYLINRIIRKYVRQNRLNVEFKILK